MASSTQKEINRYLKLINAQKLKKNHKECIELYNAVGGLCSDIGSYDEAVHYHEKAIEVCDTIGDQLNRAISLRYLGEAKASLGCYSEAISCIKRYLEIVTRLNNRLETQRAATTLGRVYLMQAEDSKEMGSHVEENTRMIAKEAEKRFQTALNLAESLKGQVDQKEFSQMKSGLMINIALVRDILGDHNDSVIKLNRAIELCRREKLKDELYRCHSILSGFFRQRNNVKMALKHSQEALLIAKQSGRKTLICEALLECGLVRIWQRDFKNAKRTFAQAYLEKSPNEEDHSKAIKFTKIAHLIATNHEQIRDDTSSESKLKLCDKLGDLLVAIGVLKLAVEFYKKAYKEARVCNKSPNERARILFSIAETYADDGQFEHALVCYEKELELRADNNEEQCQSLIKIAHMHEYLDHEHNKIVEAYERAYTKANKIPKLMYSVLRYYVPYMKKAAPNSPEYKKLECSLVNIKTFREVIEEMNNEEGEESNDIEDEIANVDDIITDDEDGDEVMMLGRKRSSKKFKPNEVGEMPLHEACIKGDFKRVKSLIGQGHEVNPRDNAGWTPLHEAANHGHYEIAEYLIEQGADVSNRGLNGMSPLHDAATNGHFEVMRLLIKNKANVIALTDSGETVLSCLRDYKKRNFEKLSERVMADYRQLEIELVNLMDQCGYNVMEENMKNLGSKTNPRASSSKALEQPPKPKPRMNVLAPISDSNPVKEYRDAIKSYTKRKRQSPDSPEKVNLPATFETSTNTSLPTKQWLIDDVSRERQVHFVDEVNSPKQSLSNICEVSEDEVEILSDDVQIVSDRRDSSRSPVNPDSAGGPPSDLSSDFDPMPRSPQRKDQGNPSPTWSLESSNGLTDAQFTEALADVPVRKSNSNEPVASTSGAPRGSVNPGASRRKLRVVIIEGTEILVAERETIGQLRESALEIYSTIVGCKPEISLSKENNKSLKLLDSYRIEDVLDGSHSLVGKIESWNLKPVDEVYERECRRLGLEPFSSIKAEIGKTSDHLDLGGRRYPQEHIKPAALALFRRDFSTASFEGSPSLFESLEQTKAILEAVVSWRFLRELSLRCVGLKRHQFEKLCSSLKLNRLESIDLSFNLIVYKEAAPFKEQVNSLHTFCPNLKRLNLKKNHLSFVNADGDGNLTDVLGLSSSSLEVSAPQQYDYSSFSLWHSA